MSRGFTSGLAGRSCDPSAVVNLQLKRAKDSPLAWRVVSVILPWFEQELGSKPRLDGQVRDPKPRDVELIRVFNVLFNARESTRISTHIVTRLQIRDLIAARGHM